jgi:hypothetical protein
LFDINLLFCTVVTLDHLQLADAVWEHFSCSWNQVNTAPHTSMWQTLSVIQKRWYSHGVRSRPYSGWRRSTYLSFQSILTKIWTTACCWSEEDSTCLLCGCREQTAEVMVTLVFIYLYVMMLGVCSDRHSSVS